MEIAAFLVLYTFTHLAMLDSCITSVAFEMFIRTLLEKLQPQSAGFMFLSSKGVFSGVILVRSRFRNF